MVKVVLVKVLIPAREKIGKGLFGKSIFGKSLFGKCLLNLVNVRHLPMFGFLVKVRLVNGQKKLKNGKSPFGKSLFGKCP